MANRKRKPKDKDINDNADGESSNKKAKTMRLKESSVYDEFIKIDDKKGKCKHCHAEITTSSCSYKSHLKAFHKEEHDRVVYQDNILLVIQRNEAEAKQGKNLQEILVKMIFCTGIPVSIVRNKFFREFCESLYPGFPHMTLQGLWAIGERMVQEMKNEMTRVLKEAKSVSLAVDAWTSFGSKNSFLGVSAQCYSPENNQLVNFTLALKHLKHSHTGSNLCDVLIGVCNQYDILNKVTSIAMDNATNMTAMMNKLNDEVDNMDVKVLLGGSPPDVNDNEEANNDMYLPHSCDLRIITEEEEIEYDELEGIRNFLQETQSLFDLEVFTEKFAKLKKVERIKCFAHTLQLAINASCTNDSYFYDILRKVRKIAVKFSRSEGPKNDLKDKEVNLLPVRTVSTRWWSDYCAILRIVTICNQDEDWESLNDVIDKYSQKPKKKKRKKSDYDADDDENLEDEDIDLKVTTEDLKKMKEYVTVFKFFMEKSDMLGSTKVVAHLVFPSVKELDYHMTNLEEKSEGEGNDDLRDFLNNLHQNFRDKFSFMLDPESEDYTPMYTACCFLSPVHSCSLSSNEVIVAKAYLKKLLHDRKAKHSSSLSEFLPLVGSPPENDNIMIQGFPLLSKLVGQKSVPQEDSYTFDNLIHKYTLDKEKELAKFKKNPSKVTCPIQYWGRRFDEPLGEIALSLLSTYPTSVSVERLFRFSSININI